MFQWFLDHTMKKHNDNPSSDVIRYRPTLPTLSMNCTSALISNEIQYRALNGIYSCISVRVKAFTDTGNMVYGLTEIDIAVVCGV